MSQSAGAPGRAWQRDPVFGVFAEIMTGPQPAGCRGAAGGMGVSLSRAAPAHNRNGHLYGGREIEIFGVIA